MSIGIKPEGTTITAHWVPPLDPDEFDAAMAVLQEDGWEIQHDGSGGFRAFKPAPMFGNVAVKQSPPSDDFLGKTCFLGFHEDKTDEEWNATLKSWKDAYIRAAKAVFALSNPEKEEQP